MAMNLGDKLGHYEIVAAVGKGGKGQVNVRAFPPTASGDGVKFPVSTDGGNFAVWSLNTNVLFFRGGPNILVARYQSGQRR